MPSLRLADLLASLSLAMDLGAGQPLEWVMRCCLMGVGLAQTLGLGERDCRDVYYLSLLRHLGCTATATLEAERFANELSLGESLTIDPKNWQQAFSFLFRHAGRGQALVGRARFIAKALAAGPASKDTFDKIQCGAALSLAGALDLPPETVWGSVCGDERWKL